ncbi:hypothetical protein FSC37_22200 [Piscinibacter aquaticus]|uniref:Uncharacterized protein n=1 Tax=Piscinibacter aquaticus TaxID=392597 RepID=A0A5C6U696_9BURK|nr:hypothetical protein FSC37_22200 [Piscinibacter aquaticus]
MQTSIRVPAVRPMALCASISLALAGCGGGGGGSTPAAPTVTVSTTNQDTVARAGMVALQAGVLGASLGVAGGGSPTALAAAAAGRKRAAAVQPPEVENCTVSGSTTTVYDDRDNSGTATLGDTATITYDDCVEVPGEVMNGTAVAVYSQIQLGTPFSIGARITTNDLVTQTATHRVAARGGFDFLISAPSLLATSSTLRVGVPEALALAITTPMYTDTVTLRAGYLLQSSYDGTALPPGGSIGGLTSTTANGLVDSTVAAGTVSVSTRQPFDQYDIDPYPRSGQFEVFGKTGAIRATVQSTSVVQIELDADGNGTFEASKTVSWSDLF